MFRRQNTERDGRRRLSRPVGCLLWLVALLVLLLILSVLFGGFQNGKKVGGPPYRDRLTAAVASGPPRNRSAGGTLRSLPDSRISGQREARGSRAWTSQAG